MEALRRSCFYALHTKKGIWPDRWFVVDYHRAFLYFLSAFSTDATGHTRQKWISRIFLVGGRTTRRLRRAWETMIDKIRQGNKGHEQLEEAQDFHHTRAGEAFLFSSSTRGMPKKKETGLAGSYDFSCWAHEGICTEGFCSSPGGGRLQTLIGRILCRGG